MLLNSILLSSTFFKSRATAVLDFVGMVPLFISSRKLYPDFVLFPFSWNFSPDNAFSPPPFLIADSIKGNSCSQRFKYFSFSILQQIIPLWLRSWWITIKRKCGVTSSISLEASGKAQVQIDNIPTLVMYITQISIYKQVMSVIAILRTL